MKAKTFKTQAAQGDTFFRWVESIPKEAKVVKKWDGVVAHSETGHHHAFKDIGAAKLYRTEDPFICYLRCETEAMLEHLRDFDTHAPILFAPGCYEVRRQREHTPEGFRMIAD